MAASRSEGAGVEIFRRTALKLMLLGLASSLICCVLQGCTEGDGRFLQQQFSCAAFGQTGIMKWADCTSVASVRGTHIKTSGDITWATKVDGDTVALCNGENTLTWWDGGEQLIDISLGQCGTPVGAVHLDGKIYVACFGGWPSPGGASGFAVVDVASKQFEAYHPYSGDAHVHNVYAFNWDGQLELFAAVLGNPWAESPLVGSGLVRFDRSSNAFMTEAKSVPLNVRSAVQQSDDTFYVLTQEPQGRQTRLARLGRDGDGFTLIGQTELPLRSGGDGGADVFLGRESDTVFCTDRTEGGGKLYYYTYTEADGFKKMNELDTGSNPRYTAALANGDVVACNQDGNSLTFFVGLFDSPQAQCDVTTVESLPAPMFFMDL